MKSFLATIVVLTVVSVTTGQRGQGYRYDPPVQQQQRPVQYQQQQQQRPVQYQQQQQLQQQDYAFQYVTNQVYRPNVGVPVQGVPNNIYTQSVPVYRPVAPVPQLPSYTSQPGPIYNPVPVGPIYNPAPAGCSLQCNGGVGCTIQCDPRIPLTVVNAGSSVGPNVPVSGAPVSAPASGQFSGHVQPSVEVPPSSPISSSVDSSTGSESTSSLSNLESIFTSDSNKKPEKEVQVQKPAVASKPKPESNVSLNDKEPTPAHTLGSDGYKYKKPASA